MIVTLNLTTNIYGPPDMETGKQKCIKRGVRYKKTFDTNQIAVQNYITTRGLISKTLSIVTHNGQEYVARHKFEELEALTKQVHITGFKEWK